jgi:hypothetical protein
MDIRQREAEASVGLDSPINRYKVRCAILRSEVTEGIRPEDRIAMLHQAEALALTGIRRFSRDKYAYLIYCQVGWKLLEATGDNSVLDAAITKARSATEQILDPDLDRALRQYEDEFRNSTRRKRVTSGAPLVVETR